MPGQALIYNEAKLTFLSNSAEAYPSDKKKASFRAVALSSSRIPPRTQLSLSLYPSLSLSVSVQQCAVVASCRQFWKRSFG